MDNTMTKERVKDQSSLDRLEAIYKMMLVNGMVGLEQLLKFDKTKKEMYIRLIQEIKNDK